MPSDEECPCTGSPESALPLVVERVLKGASIVVHVAGEVDLCTAPALASELAEAMTSEGAASRVVVDLDGVRFLDARGLAALVQAWGFGAGRGRELVLSRPSAMVRRLLKITDLEAVLHVEGER